MMDEYVRKCGLDLPGRSRGPCHPADPPCVTEPIRRLDLRLETSTP